MLIFYIKEDMGDIMYYLDDNLDFEECFTILNKLVKSLIDYDYDNNGIYYVLISGTEENYSLLKELISNEYCLNQYLLDVDCVNWQEKGFDISILWEIVCKTFDRNLILDVYKKQFLVG